MNKQLLYILVFCIPFIGFSQNEEETTDTTNKWEWQLTPYIWATGLNGTMEYSNQSGEINMSFGDSFDNLKLKGMFKFEVKKGNWSIMADYFSASIGRNASITENIDGINLDSELPVKLDQTIAELGGGYRFIKDGNLEIDVLFGARYFKADIALERTESDTDWVKTESEFYDPYVGIRFLQTWNKFGLGGQIDVGGFTVGSEISYKYNMMVAYEFVKFLELQVGYQAYNPIYREDGFVYNVSTQGVFAGLNFKLNN